jgi:hypothetical protein
MFSTGPSGLIVTLPLALVRQPAVTAVLERTIEKILLSAPYADAEKPSTRPTAPIANESSCLLMGIFLLVIDLFVLRARWPAREMARPQGVWPIKRNAKTSRA